MVKVHYWFFKISIMNYNIQYIEKSEQNKMYSSMIYRKADIQVIITQVKK